MHKSRLAGFIIDCQDADAREAAGFWGPALCMAIHEWPADEGGRYVKLVDEFPMTVTGKVQKFKMREEAIAELGLDVAAATKMA